MRPYRGMTKDGKWVKGWYVEIEGKHFIAREATGEYHVSVIEYKRIELIVNLIEVIPETVGQATGLKDKNGKESYHRDLFIHLSRNGGKPIEIVWRDGSWRGKYGIDSIDGSEFTFFLNSDEMSEAEIIGNIYENPELIK